MMYRGSDFRELFEKTPEYYLSIYAPPCRLLMDTKQSVRWGASASEHFEIQIARDLLGTASPGRRKRQVEGGLRLSPRHVIIGKTGGFDVPRLPGFATVAGKLARQTCPRRHRYVVLPRGAQVLSLRSDPGEPLLSAAVDPLPVQMSPPDVDTGLHSVSKWSSTTRPALSLRRWMRVFCARIARKKRELARLTVASRIGVESRS